MRLRRRQLARGLSRRWSAWSLCERRGACQAIRPADRHRLVLRRLSSRRASPKSTTICHGAIAYYQRALTFDPDNQSLQQSLLLALISNGDFDEALP